MTQHILYKTEDEDKPDQICDRNGEVVLAQCRLCHLAESELQDHPDCHDLCQVCGNELPCHCNEPENGI